MIRYVIRQHHFNPTKKYVFTILHKSIIGTKLIWYVSPTLNESQLISGVPLVYLLTELSVFTSSPPLHHSSRSNRALFSQISTFPARLTTTRPAQVALPVYRMGADTDTGSQRPIQSLAYEISSSAVIPYTSSAYSHIQNPVLASCLCEIEGKLDTDKVGVFLLGFKRVSVIGSLKPTKGQQNVLHKTPQTGRASVMR